MAVHSLRMSLRKGRTSLLAGTALAGTVLSSLVPAVVPAIVAIAASGVVAVPAVFLGSSPARADSVGGSGGLGPSRNYGASAGGAGGNATHPTGYTGTSGDSYNKSGGGGGGGGVGGAGGKGGGAFNGASGGAGGATAGANGSDGAVGSYAAGGGGGGGAGGANTTIVPTLANSSTLTGQAGGNGGNGHYGPGFLNSAGGGGGGGAGAYGAVVTGGGTSSNGGAGVITGGTGGNGGNGGSGGSTNNGGQAGNGGDGGIGVQFTTGAAGATFTNAGQITGGAGGAGGFGGYRFGRGNGGNGGVGVQFDARGSLINSGSITGGAGGSGGNNGYGGAGGSGLSMTHGGTLDNSGGTISGGDGGSGNARDGAGGYGAGSGRGGPGGIGIIGSGLTITNAGGTISGGMSGDGTTQAYAIQFTGGTNAVGSGGTINGGINVTGGSFMPAIANSAVGTPLAVTGPLMFASGTSYDIRITPTASDSVAASGDATLNGAKLNIKASGGDYTGSTYVILSGATVAGTFGAVKTNLAFLTPTLTYTGTEVDLSFTASATYKLAGGTQNQQAIGAALTNGASQGGGSGPVLTSLQNLTTQQAAAAFSAMSGNGLTGAQNAAFTSGALFTSSITDQTTGSGGTTNSITVTDGQPGFMAYAPTTDTPRTVIAPIHELADLPSLIPPPVPVAPGHTWHAWATGFGGAQDIDGNAGVGSAAQTSTIYGGTVGVDYRVSENYLAGVAIGGSNADFSVNGGTSGTVTGGHIAYYDLFTLGAFYATTTTSASFYSNTTNRFVSVGGASETDRGNFDSHEFRSSAEFGRHFTTAYGLITPFVGLQIAELRSYGFRELPISGAGNFVLNVSGQTTASVPSFLGLRLQRTMSLGNGMTFSPVLQAAWVHEFSPQRNVVAGLVNLPGATFLATGASPASNAAQVKAGGELALNANSALFANFDGTFSGVDRLYAGKGGFRYVW